MKWLAKLREFWGEMQNFLLYCLNDDIKMYENADVNTRNRFADYYKTLKQIREIIALHREILRLTMDDAVDNKQEIEELQEKVDVANDTISFFDTYRKEGILFNISMWEDGATDTEHLLMRLQKEGVTLGRFYKDFDDNRHGSRFNQVPVSEVFRQYASATTSKDFVSCLDAFEDSFMKYQAEVDKILTTGIVEMLNVVKLRGKVYQSIAAILSLHTYTAFGARAIQQRYGE